MSLECEPASEPLHTDYSQLHVSGRVAHFRQFWNETEPRHRIGMDVDEHVLTQGRTCCQMWPNVLSNVAELVRQEETTTTGKTSR